MNYDVLIIIILSILLLISTFISTRGKLMDRRKMGIKAITKTGRSLILINFFILLILIAQQYYKDYQTRIKEIEYKKNQEKRDSLLKATYDSSLLQMKSRFDTSNLKVVSTVTKILGKYGYQLDSTNEKLIKIMNKPTGVPDPVLKCMDFKEYKVEKNKTWYVLKMVSYDASSAKYDITCRIYCVNKKEHFKRLSTKKILTESERLSKDAGKGNYLNLDHNVDCNMIYYHLSGSYMNSDRTKVFRIDDYHYYNLDNKSFGYLNNDSEIVEIIKKMEMNNLKYYINN